MLREYASRFLPRNIPTSKQQIHFRQVARQIHKMPPKPPSRPPLTHFLCLPLVTSSSKPQLQASLDLFTSEITQKADPGSEDVGARIGVPGKAVRPVGTLHLTLGVMSLRTQARVDEALALLRSIDARELLEKSRLRESVGARCHEAESIQSGREEASGEQHDDGQQREDQPEQTTPHPLQLSLKGLVPMHSLKSTSILYTSPVSLTHDIQGLCQSLVSIFTSAGFMVPETRPLLLHATVLNTIYVPKVRQASDRGRGGHGKYKAKLTIDATGILERFGEHVWMEEDVIRKVAICRMGAKASESGGEEYFEEGALELLG